MRELLTAGDRLAAFRAALDAWRALTEAEQLAAMGAADDDARVRLAMRVELCEFGSGPCGCGAEPRNCSRPGRPAQVFRHQCIQCQGEGASSPGPTPA